jgi:hypothetical protein
MSDNQVEVFESKLDTFVRLSKLSYNDNILWYDILSKGLLPTYMPVEFVWKNRQKPWDWQCIQKEYKIGSFMYACRNESWSYRYMLDEYYSRH